MQWSQICIIYGLIYNCTIVWKDGVAPTPGQVGIKVGVLFGDCVWTCAYCHVPTYVGRNMEKLMTRGTEFCCHVLFLGLVAEGCGCCLDTTMIINGAFYYPQPSCHHSKNNWSEAMRFSPKHIAPWMSCYLFVC